MTNQNQLTLDAHPTKEFFIEMLTRDIELVPAIVDLVDNCVDGARRLRGSRTYKGLTVRLQVDPDHFTISDDCGGIDLDTALQYAFRFGRPSGMESTPHSIGQFGVGMKRALFKLGSEFKISSTAAKSKFDLSVNVPDWSGIDEWVFPVDGKRLKKATPPEKRGTTIEVTSLHAGVSQDFGLETFRSQLREELSRAHQESVSRGLTITLNGVPISVKIGELLQSADLKPALTELSLNGTGEPVETKIYCGVSESDPSEAGWNVYCNGRLVLEADQTAVTGWGAQGEGLIPKYHNQFARFRGFVFMESDDAGRLPWNTTKTGVSTDSDIYRKVRQEMIVLMRPVIDFLNRLDAEMDREEEHGPGPLAQAVSNAKLVAVAKSKPSDIFVAPKPKPKSTAPKDPNISYKRPKSKIDAVKKVLGVTSNRAVGEETFDYFFEAECDE